MSRPTILDTEMMKVVSEVESLPNLASIIMPAASWSRLDEDFVGDEASSTIDLHNKRKDEKVELSGSSCFLMCITL